MEEVALAVVPVPQLLPELLRGGKDDRQENGSLLLVGDVNYDAGTGPTGHRRFNRGAPRGDSNAALLTWGHLEATRSEISAIRNSFEHRFPKSAVTELSDKEATEGRVCQEAPRHRNLHFATHGFFAPPRLQSVLAPPQPGQSEAWIGPSNLSGFHPSLLSGLVLAGANRPMTGTDRDDGILTALEVAQIDLGDVDLAVLSACETGLGASAGGEGLLGLQRAFQVAGARSVVAGLWKVSDGTTRELMQRFYDNLWRKKMPRLEALREAQMWMLRQASKQPEVLRGLDFADQLRPREDQPLPPYYWAAFVLSGDWR
jgi:CHAT domain-containing protein